MLIRILCTVLFLCIVAVQTIDTELFKKYNEVVTYDYYFKKYTKRYFSPGFDWRFFKAQAIAESGLEERPISYAGAVGIMQILPKTYEQIKKNNSTIIKGSLRNARWNIAAGISYDRDLWDMFKNNKPFKDKLNFMFGSYNSGVYNIIQAQHSATRKGLNPNSWSSIEKSLQQVTGRQSHQTINYVQKIWAIKGVLN
ncbi:MAG: transglycosylase SLT domain-containing protein [Desulfobacterales bacterium]|nr:transglycosylase SLT domain-containing protein [Desulfobacterales bacterium]